MKWQITIDGKQHGELWNEEDGVAAINAAVDLIDPPKELRPLFRSKFLNGEYADDGKRRVAFGPVES